MPNFQGAVNEVINQAGLYSSLAGGPQDLKERIRLGKEEKIAGEQLQNLMNDAADSIDSAEFEDRVGAYRHELSRLAENSLDIRERKYQLNPTKKNYDAVMDARDVLGSIREVDSLRERQNQAMKKMEEQAEAKKTQRRNFMAYITQQPTSLGGTVGDLPKEAQKQIASQYTRSQRKTMMDRMDEEAKNGKQE